MSEPEFVDLDYEEIDTTSKDAPDDFISMSVDRVLGFDWMMLLAVAISFIFVVSDFFNDRVLHRFPKAIGTNDEITNHGYIIQLISLLIGTILGKIIFSLTSATKR